MDLDTYTCGWCKLLHTWMVRFSPMRKVSFPSYPHSIFSRKCLDFHLLISPRPFWQREATRLFQIPPFDQVCSNGRLRLRINMDNIQNSIWLIGFYLFLFRTRKFFLCRLYSYFWLFIYLFAFFLSFFNKICPFFFI